MVFCPHTRELRRYDASQRFYHRDAKTAGTACVFFQDDGNFAAIECLPFGNFGLRLIQIATSLRIIKFARRDVCELSEREDMKTWKAASAVFQGGTQQINALRGKRVRTKAVLSSARVYDPIYNRQETTDLQRGTVGFVSNPLADELLIAFPRQEHTRPNSLEALMRNCMFFVVVINGPTFKAQFDVEL